MVLHHSTGVSMATTFTQGGVKFAKLMFSSKAAVMHTCNQYTLCGNCTERVTLSEISTQEHSNMCTYEWLQV